MYVCICICILDKIIRGFFLPLAENLIIPPPHPPIPLRPLTPCELRLKFL